MLSYSCHILNSDCTSPSAFNSTMSVSSSRDQKYRRTAFLSAALDISTLARSERRSSSRADTGFAYVVNGCGMPVDPKAPHLLNFPDEVRNNIWKLLVVKEDDVQPSLSYVKRNYLTRPASRVSRDDKPELMKMPSERTPLAVARTCSAVSTEVYKVYFTQNSFKLNHGGEIDKFLGGHIPRHLKYLRTLAFAWQRLSAGTILLLKECTGLRQLTLQLNICSLPNHLFLYSQAAYQVSNISYLKQLEELRILKPELFELHFRNFSPRPHLSFQDADLVSMSEMMTAIIRSGSSSESAIMVADTIA